MIFDPAALIATGWSKPVPGRVYLRCGPPPFHGARYCDYTSTGQQLGFLSPHVHGVDSDTVYKTFQPGESKPSLAVVRGKTIRILQINEGTQNSV